MYQLHSRLLSGVQMHSFMVSSKNVLFVPRAYLCLVDVEMLHAAPGIITVSSPVNLSSPIVSCCGYNLYGLK